MAEKKVENDQLSWIGFGNDISNLEIVIYFNDLEYFKRIKNDFCNFSKKYNGINDTVRYYNS